MLGFVVFLGFGEFAPLLKEALRRTGVEVNHRRIAMLRRFDLPDAIVNLLSRPISACQPSQRAAEENHRDKDESNQRTVKCAAIAKAVGAALHKKDDRTNIVSCATRHTLCRGLAFGRLLGVTRFRRNTRNTSRENTGIRDSRKDHDRLLANQPPISESPHVATRRQDWLRRLAIDVALMVGAPPSL